MERSIISSQAIDIYIKHEILGSYMSEEAQIFRTIDKKFTHHAFRQVDTRKPSYM